VGGRQWINSATLTARRQFIESLFAALDENSLNADEQIEIVAARSNGMDHFTVSDESLRPLANADSVAAVDQLAGALLPGPLSSGTRESLEQFLVAGANPSQRLRRLRRASVVMMQSPEYQLC
jgi:hypothetical protein